MSEQKAPKSAETSLGYISWSLKEISENIKKLVAIVEGYKTNSKGNTGDLPF